MAWLNAPQEWIVISDDEYFQSVAIKKEPAVYIDGEVTSWRLNAYTMRVRDRVEECRGLTYTAALAISEETIQPAGGEEYNFEALSVKISRKRSNEAGGWTVTKTTSWRALYVNGIYAYGASLKNFS